MNPRVFGGVPAAAEVALGVAGHARIVVRRLWRDDNKLPREGGIVGDRVDGRELGALILLWDA